MPTKHLRRIVLLTPRQEQWLKHKSKETGAPLTELVRRAVDKACEVCKKPVTHGLKYCSIKCANGRMRAVIRWDDDKIIKLRQAGKNAKKIAEELGVSHQRVLWRLRILKNEGYPVDMPSLNKHRSVRIAWNDEELLKLKSAGLTILSIAAVLKVSGPAVCQRLRKIRRAASTLEPVSP